MSSKRYESDLTIVIDRDRLPPRSTVPGPTIDQLADIEMNLREAQDAVATLVPCPECEKCPSCHGLHMVSIERRRAHQIVAAGLDQLDEVDDG